MFVQRIPNLLKLSLGLSFPLLIFRTYAYGSVSVPPPEQRTLLLTQFEPMTTDSLEPDTDITTPGGRNTDINITEGLYFQPPPDTGEYRGPRTITATRGSCSNSADGAVFSGLGPRTIPGLTTSVYPEFVWYMTEVEPDSPMLFRLLALDENGQASVVDSANLSAQAGFMRYQLPESGPPLEIGKDYLWQVIVRCDPERPSSLWASTLSLQVVTPTSELTNALAAATTDAEKATAYGNAGIWYNALALVSAGMDTAETDVRTGLLQDLATLEGDDEIFSTTLKTIVEQSAVNSSP